MSFQHNIRMQTLESETYRSFQKGINGCQNHLTRRGSSLEWQSPGLAKSAAVAGRPTKQLCGSQVFCSQTSQNVRLLGHIHSQDFQVGFVLEVFGELYGHNFQNICILKLLEFFRGLYYHGYAFFQIGEWPRLQLCQKWVDFHILCTSV